MKKFMITILLGLALVLSTKGVSETDEANSVFIPWYNESSAYDTWLIFTNGGTAISSGDFNLIARNLDGTLVGSTNPTIGAHKNLAIALGSAITATTTSGNTTGNLQITADDSALDNLNIFVVVQGTASGAAGFVVPVYGDGGTGNKYDD